MVVSPQLQGQGIGSSALKVALAEADLAKKPVMLTTNEVPRVVSIFTVQEELPKTLQLNS